MTSLRHGKKGVNDEIPSYNVESYFRKKVVNSQRPKPGTDIFHANVDGMENRGLCSFCRTLDFAKLFTPSSECQFSQVCCHLEHFITWDLSAVLRNHKCSFCRLLLQGLLGTSQGQSPWLECSFVMGHIEGFETAEFQETRQIDLSGRRMWITASKQCHNEFSRDSGPHDSQECWETRRTYDRAITLRSQNHPTGTINPNIILAWLSTCDKTHDQCTPRTMPTTSPFELRVIDVFQGCITPAPPNCKYFALSYVWGGIEQLRLTKENLHVLTQEQPFPSNFRGASKTVMDAMGFCRLIGQRYLWIDTLCIIQNDAVDQRAQIQSMDLVYSCAHATIVAAAGTSAKKGLIGVGSSSRQDPTTECIENLQLTVTQRHALISIMDAPWNTRAWTFQENIFSRRLIVFTDYQMTFSCNKTLWREDKVIESDSLALGDHRPCSDIQHLQLAGPTQNLDSSRASWAFATYQAAIGEYILRKLTREIDILDAFSGVQSTLTPILGPFRWGLPSCCFEAALTWRSKDQFPISRREGFPSWSWAGWKDYKHRVDFSTNEKKGISGQFSYGYGSEVTWYQVNEDYLLDMISNEKPHQFSTSVLMSYHRSRTRSKYHVSQINLPSNLATPLSQYLVFWTNSAVFKVGRVMKRHFEDMTSAGFRHEHPEFEVQNKWGNRIGTICLDPNWRERQPDEMEFIVVATDSQCNFFAMLIQWKDGVASRVQMSSDPISQDRWVPSERKMIVLG